MASSDFSLLPAIFGERPHDPERDRRVLETYRTAADTESEPRFLAYFEGRVLQRSGKHLEAAQRFDSVVAVDPERPEPLFRLVECLRSVGDSQQARDRLQIALGTQRQNRRELWDLWTAVSLVDLRRSPAAVLAEIPRPPEPEAYHDDLRWLLQVLISSDQIRINCGGDDYEDTAGTQWGRDRFFIGGSESPGYVIDISGTEDDSLYHTGRAVPYHSFRPSLYRVPLPAGRYRVSLHFAETDWQARRARFDVTIESKPFLENYRPWDAGFATADVRTRVVTVEDGLLDIEIVRKHRQPRIAAIAIARLAEE